MEQSKLHVFFSATSFITPRRIKGWLFVILAVNDVTLTHYCAACKLHSVPEKKKREREHERLRLMYMGKKGGDKLHKRKVKKNGENDKGDYRVL